MQRIEGLSPTMAMEFFREIFDSLQFQDFVLIDKIPFYSAFLKAIVLLIRVWTAVNTKNKEIQLKNVWSRRDLNPALQIQSQLCLPLDQSFMKIVKKRRKILDQVLKSSNFKH